MKKFFIIVLSVLLVLSALLYFLVPSPLVVAGYERIPVPQPASGRGMVQTKNWAHWWPGKQADSLHLEYNDGNYTITSVNLQSVGIIVEKNGRKFEGHFNVTEQKTDSSIVSYELALKTPDSWLIYKPGHYFAARGLKTDLDHIVREMSGYLSVTKNIYGIPIIQTRVKDSSLISVKIIENKPPSTVDIYRLIDRLYAHIAAHKAVAMNAPMLNTIKLNESSYQAMVAIPINKDIPVTGDLVIKKMVLGNILEAEVIGEPATIRRAEGALKQYVDDYGLESPAIPFQSLITNRRSQPDSALWITRLSYPIF